MFARSHLVQTTLAKLNNSDDSKTDEELMREAEAEELRLEQEEEEHNPDNYENEYVARYVEFSNLARQLCKGKYEHYFNSLMILVIILAGILVGIQTYPSMSDAPILSALETVCLTAFIVEFVLKIIAEALKPHHYFIGPEGGWNTFDFCVILVCLPFFDTLIGGKSQVIRMFSRLSRLVRASKIVHQVPALQVIITGLIGGLKSIMYIALLLSIVFYLYGVLGVSLFGANDPFHFRNVPIAIVTLFRACTLDGWSAIFFLQAYGCASYDAGLYQQEEEMTADEWSKYPDIYKCTAPSAQPVVAASYFVSFIVVSALVMLSLFVGIITMSMQQSLEDMRKSVEESNRKGRLLKQTAELTAVSMKTSAIDNASKFISNISGRQVSFFGNRSGTKVNARRSSTQFDQKQNITYYWQRFTSFFANGYARLHGFIFQDNDAAAVLSMKEAKKLKEFKEMKALMMQAWGRSVIAENYHHDLDVIEGFSLARFKRNLSLLSHTFIESKQWNHFMTFTILCTAFIIGFSTDNEPKGDENLILFYLVFENLIFAIFLIDLLGRMAMDEFIFSEYFKSGWNCFDFIIVVSCKLPGGGAIVNILRLLRLLRVLKLVKALPELQVIVNALIMGLTSIGYIGMIILLTFYLFSILALILFGVNDPFKFGLLHRSIFTLFDVATLDNWSDVMYAQIYGCDLFPPPLSRTSQDDDHCINPARSGVGAAIFFIFFVVIGAFIMLTLFVGVVTTSMEEAQQNQELERHLEEKVRGIQMNFTITDEQLDIYRRVFSLLDLDGGGTIEKDELRFGLKCVDMNPTDEELEEWILKCDQNSDGVIDLIEFCVFMTHMQEIAEIKRKELEAIEDAKKKEEAEWRAAELKARGGDAAVDILGKNTLSGLSRWKDKAMKTFRSVAQVSDGSTADAANPPSLSATTVVSTDTNNKNINNSTISSSINSTTNSTPGSIKDKEAALKYKKASDSDISGSSTRSSSSSSNNNNREDVHTPQSDAVSLGLANQQYLQSMPAALERRKLGNTTQQSRAKVDINSILHLSTFEQGDEVEELAMSVLTRGKAGGSFIFIKDDKLTSSKSFERKRNQNDNNLDDCSVGSAGSNFSTNTSSSSYYHHHHAAAGVGPTMNNSMKRLPKAASGPGLAMLELSSSPLSSAETRPLTQFKSKSQLIQKGDQPSIFPKPNPNPSPNQQGNEGNNSSPPDSGSVTSVGSGSMSLEIATSTSSKIRERSLFRMGSV